jgi:hypothetical protein
MGEHTPGPWIFTGYSIWGPEHNCSRHKNSRILVAEVAFGSARAVPGLAHGADRFGFAPEADARLIAAAPELLQALDRLLPVAERFEAQASRGTGGRRGGAVFTAARAAIAKARGQ